MGAVKRALHDNGLSLFFGLIFLLSLVGQAVAGTAEFNDQQRKAALPDIGILEYVTSADFATDVTENWQSEYLQFVLYLFVTVWLVQRGSAESKELDKAGRESDEEQLIGPYATPDSPGWAKVAGLRRSLYSHSLSLTMLAIFLLSWLAQSISGVAAHNEERLRDLQAPLSWWSYVQSPDFWSRTFQDWQSEFLAVGSMVVLSIYLRERGSPESKPVGEPHSDTGVTG